MKTLGIISTKELKAALKLCLPIASKDNLNFSIQHVNLCMSDSEEFTIASTDGSRLAVWDVLSHKVLSDSTNTGSLCLSVKDSKRLLKLIDNNSDLAEIRFSENRIRFVLSDLSIEFSLPECSYPVVQYMRPKEFSFTTVVNKTELESTLNQFAIAKNNLLKVNLHIDFDQDSIKVKSKYHDEVQLDTGLNTGVPVKIGAMVHSLLSGLKLFKGERIQINLKDPKAPILMQDISLANFSYIIMPTNRFDN